MLICQRKVDKLLNILKGICYVKKMLFVNICENDTVNNVVDNVTLHQNGINVTDNCNMTMDDSELLEDQITLEQKENLTAHVLPSIVTV